MRQFTIFFTLVSFLLVPLAGLHAEEIDAYADSIVTVTNEVLTSTNALGAPDGSSADYMDRDQYIYFDLGEGEEGIGDLKLYITLLNWGAGFRVDFYDAAEGLLDSWSYSIQIGVSEVTADYQGTEAYRYVKVTSFEDEVWKLDAIEVLEMYEEEEVVVEEEEEEEENGLGELSGGRLIKLADDNNPETTYDTAVYTVGLDGKRHAFPSESVFYSWWENFDDVEEITQDEMDLYSLSKNVTMRPGTKLITIQSSPDVYAVEPGGIVRKITTEEIAVDLFGADWTDRVVDVADGFWGNYTKGEDITSAVHPSGSFLISPNGEFIYLSNGNWYSVAGADWSSMRLVDDNFLLIEEDIFSLYVDGGQLVLTTEIMYPY
jgi:hypothetical protein